VGFERQESKPKLTKQQIDMCFVHMLRDRELFAYTKQHLNPKHFSQVTELYYALIWQGALRAAEKNNGFIPDQGTELILATEVLTLIENAGAGISEDEQNKVMGLINWIFSIGKDQLNPPFYKQLIQDLIIERTVLNEVTKSITSTTRPIDIVKAMNAYSQKLQAVMSDSSKVSQSAFPTDFKPKKMGKFSTGLPFIDNFMNGGQAPGEVYTLQGPSGLGKTTMGVMLTVETARLWNEAYAKGVIPKPKVSCIFTWEQDTNAMRMRYWQYAATIATERIEGYVDEKIQLSTKGNPEEYELEEFAEQIAVVGRENIDCESERLAAATKELGEAIRIVDFSGGDPDNPQVGSGGMEEVAAVLRSIVNEGYDIGVVILDYAITAVGRWMAAKGEDPSAALRHRLRSFCNEARIKLALPFNCPIWCFNQVNTEANRKSPTAEQHHSFSSECAAFSENAFFAFTFGTKDTTKDMALLWCTKQRRASSNKPNVALKIDGQFCRMRDVSESIVIDQVNRTFVDKKDLNKRATMADIKGRQAKSRITPAELGSI
jgi:hypothetical protein